MITLLILFAGTSLVLALIAIPMALGKVEPNPWYGFRTRATLENPELWYKVNRYSGWWLLIVGIVSFCLSLILFPIFYPDISTYSTVYGLITVSILTLSMMDSMRYMRKWK
jgi:uncharacterized membrane protein